MISGLYVDRVPVKVGLTPSAYCEQSCESPRSDSELCNITMPAGDSSRGRSNRRHTSLKSHRRPNCSHISYRSLRESYGPCESVRCLVQECQLEALSGIVA